VDWLEESGHKSVEEGRKAKMGSAYRDRTAASYWHSARPPRSLVRGQNPSISQAITDRIVGIDVRHLRI
jgi:hypothetical protein